MLELQSGSIELDGIDVRLVNLELLRERCFITVSQDALLLSNETLRFNLDPESSLPGGVIVEALMKTNLLSHFLNIHLTDGQQLVNMNDSDTQHQFLDRKISSLPELSVGQCQLFALCRALLKAEMTRSSGCRPVVLLDEATSSLDSATEETIHRIIDEEFTKRGHTVVVVAHRVGVMNEYTEAGRDMVVVLGDGRLQEIVTDLRPNMFEEVEDADE